MMDLEQLKYPVGRWIKPSEYQPLQISAWIDDIANFPALFSGLLSELPESHYAQRYRPEGWTLRQLAHHVADSHLHAYIRHKLAVTENQPTINPYKEALWAEMEDVKTVPVSHSLQLLKDLHLRWTVFLNHLKEEEYTRSFLHPENNRIFLLYESISMYAWHCRHHLAHAQNALQNPYL